MRPDTPCSRCGGLRERKNQSHCRRCHAAYMREYRAQHPDKAPRSQLVRAKDEARRLARAAKDQGAIVAQPCQACGAPLAEMHHPNYDLPLEVIWLCHPCHVSWHVHARQALSNLWNAFIRLKTAA